MADVPALRLPRSVLAALWLPRVRDLGSVTRASAAITGDDEPHVAVLGRTQLNLAGLFATVSPPTVVGAALPAPGSLGGAPGAVAAEALAAGECLVVAARQTAWVAVPEVRRFGSHLEAGARVSWSVTEAPGAERGLLASLGSLSDARAGLVRALHQATDLLTQLDIGRRGPEAELVEQLHLPLGWPLPPDLEPDRLDMLGRAARLLAVVELARRAKSAAVSARQEDRRSAALREVESAARLAMSAATAYVHIAPDG